MPTALGSTFATTMRMINRIHRRAADMRTPTHPPFSPGLAEHNTHMI